MEELPGDEGQEPRKHLTRSRGGDIALGLVAGVVWWLVGGALVATAGGNSGLVGLVVIAGMVGSSVVLLATRSYTRRFVIWQLLSCLLVPVVVIGLVFGACMMGSGGHL